MRQTISHVVTVCLIVVLISRMAVVPAFPSRHADPQPSEFSVEALATRPGTFRSTWISASAGFFALAAAVAAGTGLWARNPHLSAPNLSVQSWMTIFSCVGILMAIDGDPGRKKAGLHMSPSAESPLYLPDSYRTMKGPAINPTESVEIAILDFLRRAPEDVIAKVLKGSGQDVLTRMPGFQQLLNAIVKRLVQDRPGSLETLEMVRLSIGGLFELLLVAYGKGFPLIAAPALRGLEQKGLLYFLSNATGIEIVNAMMAADHALRGQSRFPPNYQESLVKMAKLLVLNRPGPAETLEEVRDRTTDWAFDSLQAAERKGFAFINAPVDERNIKQPAIVVADPEILDRLPRDAKKVKSLVQKPGAIFEGPRLRTAWVPKTQLHPPLEGPSLSLLASSEPPDLEKLLDFLFTGDEIDFATAIAAAADAVPLLQILGSEEYLIKMVKSLAQDPPRALDDVRLRTDQFYELLLEAQSQGLALITPPTVRQAVTEELRKAESTFPLAKKLQQASHSALSEPTAVSIAMAIITQRRALIETTFKRWGRDAGIFPWAFHLRDVNPKLWIVLVLHLYEEARTNSGIMPANNPNRLRRPA